MRPLNYPQAPHQLWEHFYCLSQIPRPSKKEHRVREYLRAIATEKAFEYSEDAVGNVVIKVPGRGRSGQAPVLAIQNHLDMVCDKLPSLAHDFEQDPLQLKVEGDFLMASGTTLGADNGVGVAAALALATTEEIDHPPLELVFTVDEETGLGGALNLDASLIKARTMLNLDTEQWGCFYVGCAGGRDWEFSGQFKQENTNAFDLMVEIVVSSLTGGHSGIDIDRQRGNALLLLAQTLQLADQLNLPFALCAFHGGRAHNIIPRESKALIKIRTQDLAEWEHLLEQMLKESQAFLPLEDRTLEFSLQESVGNFQSVSSLRMEEAKRFLGFILNLPHGAHTFVKESQDPLVSLSSNVAIIHLTGDGQFYANVSLRFFIAEEISGLERKIASLAAGFGILARSVSGYPNWRPMFQYPLLEKAQNLYLKKYRQPAKVLAIHAGLECGIIKDKLGDIQVLSFGPTIEGAHSPTERLHISTVSDFWSFLVELVTQIS